MSLIFVRSGKPEAQVRIRVGSEGFYPRSHGKRLSRRGRFCARTAEANLRRIRKQVRRGCQSRIILSQDARIPVEYVF
jgi:hypothetical protein